MIAQLNIKVLVITLLVFLGLTTSTAINNHSDMVLVPTTKLAVDSKQIQCMAKNIFYEAGSESIKGQAAVARVVLNRVAHGFAKSPCGVIYQTTTINDTTTCQFSWVCEGKGDPNKNSYRYKVAHQVAYDVMVYNKYPDVIPKSILFFHNLSVTPLWAHQEAIKIGNHIFYSKSKRALKSNKKDFNNDEA